MVRPAELPGEVARFITREITSLEQLDLLPLISFALLGVINPTAETRPYIHALRLLAFVLIIVATIDTNRGRA